MRVPVVKRLEVKKIVKIDSVVVRTLMIERKVIYAEFVPKMISINKIPPSRKKRLTGNDEAKKEYKNELPKNNRLSRYIYT